MSAGAFVREGRKAGIIAVLVARLSREAPTDERIDRGDPAVCSAVQQGTGDPR